MRLIRPFLRVVAFLACVAALAAAEREGRYALILSGPSVVSHAASLKTWRNQAGREYQLKIEKAQSALRAELAARSIPVTGAVQTLLNAVFVEAPRGREAELNSLPGVKRAVFLPRVRPLLDRAVELVNAPAAWNALGGVRNAGQGLKIAILDTGIDQNHPGFQDPTLPVPAGFPICRGSDCAFTNNKVIVARSYVVQLAAGTGPNPAANSRPDDPSPRDRVGHGTALAMVAAGVTNSGPVATITGMAPRAWVGNYKVFGSPGINDFTSGDIIIQALEDALNDGMDIAVLSLGIPAFSGPLDQGQACGESPGTPCDPQAAAAENAVRAGLTVVAAAGNEGDLGDQVPTLATIDSPGISPSVITVGASTNSHTFVNAVRLSGPQVPQNLQTIVAVFGDGPLPDQPVTAPVRDVATLNNDGLACAPLPNQSLAGTFALVQRGQCTFVSKVQNAEQAGAVGVIFYQQNGSSGVTVPGGLSNTDIPSVMISNPSGVALKQFLSGNPDYPATLDPNLVEVDVSTGNIMADFSSRGPATGTGAIKPEVVAVGTDLYMATQSFDPNGAMYDKTGYTVADGTSFSTPMVAGGVALVKQKNPGFTPGQLKSAVVNTASQDLTGSSGGVASVISAGAGKLDAGAAVTTTVTVEPSTISFGFLHGNTAPAPVNLKIANTGPASVSLTLTIAQRDLDPNARVNLSATALNLAPGQSQVVTATLTGSAPQPGSYSGFVGIQGGPVNLRVPYLYVMGDNVPANIFPMAGDGFDGTVNQSVPDGLIAFKLIDQYGAPVSGVPVRWRVSRGGGQIQQPDSQTDSNGLAGAGAILGPNPGTQSFQAQAGGGPNPLTWDFVGSARFPPVIAPNGSVNAASFQVGNGVAPGSYISIFGSGLSDSTRAADSARLPISMENVSVGFDVPSAGISVPGALYFVSPGQINVQVPWELGGQNSAQIKVIIGDTIGNLYTLPLNNYSPAFFEYNESASVRFVAALDQTNRIIGSQNPARRGQTIQLYANGLGPVDNPPATGQPAPSDPLARTVGTPTVTVGGRPATVQFSGLAPGFPGLYQLNVTVPPDAPTGVQQAVVSIGGITSKAANIPVQ